MSTSIRNINCSKCGLCKTTDVVCKMPDNWQSQRDLMIIGDYPAEKGSSKFDLFWTIFRQVVKGLEDRVYFTHVAKCSPELKQKPSEAEYLTCASSYIRKEIFNVKPKVILLLGAPAMATFGLRGTVSSIAGQVNSMTFTKGEETHAVSVIVTQSPAYYQYNTADLKTFAVHVEKAWKIAIGVTTETEAPTKVTLCTTLAQVKQVIKYVLQTKQCAFDFETTKLNDRNVYDPNFRATLLAVSFQHGSAYTIPLFHYESPFSDAEVLYILRLFAKHVWGNPDIHKVNQNIKFDMHVAATYGHNVFRGRVDCTMIMHSLYDDLTKHGIKEWIPKFFPKFLGWELDVKGKAWDKIPLSILSPYAGVDADGALRGYTILTTKLLADQRVYDLYRNLYAFALRTFFRMERRGMLIGRDDIIKYEERALVLIAEQYKKLHTYVQVAEYINSKRKQVVSEKLAALRTRLDKAKGKNAIKVQEKIDSIKSGKLALYEGVNFNSPPQICELLYYKPGFGFKVPYDKKSREAKEQTGEDIIKHLGDKTGFINDLLVYRKLITIQSKYLTGIRLQMDEHDCVHTTYNQARVKTGRASSGGVNSGPNLQNIITHVKIKHPFVEELTGLPKKAFKVPKGYALMNLDFSQAELRMMAEFAVEQKMIDAYNQNKDLHIITACAISHITMEQFMALPEIERKELRQKAKSANFGLIYGQSPEGFQIYARDKYGVDMTLKEANRIWDAFFVTYPKILEYHATYQAKCRKYGYVRTLFGRTCHYPDVTSTNQTLRGNAERELVNAPIQGSNGENTIFALALLEHRLPASVLLSNTIHDSIMMMVPYHLVPYAAKIGVHTCENVPQLRFFGKEMKRLKMKADVQISTTNWKDLKDYDEEKWLKEFACRSEP